LGAVVDELLELRCNLYKCARAVRLVVGNALLAITQIRFKCRSTGTESRGFADSLGFQETVIAPRITCWRHRRLGLSYTDHWGGSLDDCRGIGIRHDLVLNKYIIRETKVTGIDLEVRVYRVPPQVRVVCRRGVAIKISVPQLRHREGWSGYAFIWRAIVVLGWQANLEVTILLLWFAQIARRTTPGVVGW
jgi:hypothetical protein